MIKNASLFTLNIYQVVFSTALKNILGVNAMCRFDETCSAYTKRMIIEKGVLKGMSLGLFRILKCQPLTS